MSASTSSRRNSILLASVIALALAVWLLSGLGDDLPAAAGNRNASERDDAVSVTVRRSFAIATQRTITVSARTEPDRVVELKAETQGRIVEISAERGAPVAVGEAILALDVRDRQARLTEASARIRQRQLEFEAATRLRQDGFISAAELAAAETELEAARAEHRLIELDIQRTRVTAPFDSVVHDRMVEIGDYVGIGDPLVRIVDTDPLIVVGHVNEKDIGTLSIGRSGLARVLDGPQSEGTIRYLAPLADESTRSFRVELAVPNPDRKLLVGTSAELILGAEEISAHVISPGLLTLADDGTIGVMVVDEKNRARFASIELVASADDGVLVTGLPETVTIISVGQNYVTDGQAVAPVEDALTATGARDERPN